MEQTSQPFPVTRWSLIWRAARPGDPVMRAALDELLRRYLPALRTHLILSRRLEPDRADELLQSFIARRILEQKILQRAAPEKGRFRTFLLSAMNNYLIDELRAAQAAKRNFARPGTNLDERVADSRRQEPSREFDLAWARQVIQQAAELVRQECLSNDRADIWQVLHGRVLAPALEGAAPVSYQRIVEQFNYRTPEQASNVLISGKRAFQRALRQVVADYVQHESEVDDELRELRQLVSRTL
jgi:RNA polymerase sigma-70 factor (ECF subfamily)